jgi:hypothetical protein
MEETDRCASQALFVARLLDSKRRPERPTAVIGSFVADAGDDPGQTTLIARRNRLGPSLLGP